MTFFLNKNATRNPLLSLNITLAVYTRQGDKKGSAHRKERGCTLRHIPFHFMSELILFLHRSVSQCSHEEVIELLYGRNQATFVW